MYLSREPGLVLDVDDPLASGSYRCGYHGGGAERRQPAVHDRKTVHDPGLHPVNRDQEVAGGDLIVDALLAKSYVVGPLVYDALDVVSGDDPLVAG